MIVMTNSDVSLMDTVTSYNNQANRASRIVMKSQINVVHAGNEKMRETKKEAQTVQANGNRTKRMSDAYSVLVRKGIGR